MSPKAYAIEGCRDARGWPEHTTRSGVSGSSTGWVTCLPSFQAASRQRVAIARALVGDPAVVFADEPTGNLDTKTSDGIVGLLEELNSAGSTIVVITHNHEVAARFFPTHRASRWSDSR